MLKKSLKYLAVIVFLLLVGYNSVYFKKLDEVKSASESTFDARSYARNYLEKQLIPGLGKAVPLDTLIRHLQEEPGQAFRTHSNAIGIGNIRYFLVKGDALVAEVEESQVAITLPNDPAKRVYKIATEYVFGNALRDASGIIKIEDFTNTIDLNNVSDEINKIIRNEMLPGFRSRVKEGDRLRFAGAIQLNREHLVLDDVEIIPVTLQIID